MNKRSTEQQRARIDAIRAQLDRERMAAQHPQEYKMPLWLKITLTILLLPVYAAFLPLWLAWKIFNFGMKNGWKREVS